MWDPSEVEEVEGDAVEAPGSQGPPLHLESSRRPQRASSLRPLSASGPWARRALRGGGRPQETGGTSGVAA